MSEPIVPVKDHIARRAHLDSMEEYERLYRLSIDNPEWFWAEQAKTISWFHPWHKVFDADYEEIARARRQRSLQVDDPDLVDQLALPFITIKAVGNVMLAL